MNEDIKSVGQNVAKQAAYGFVSRGTGGAIRGATQATTSGAITKLAERSADKYRKPKQEETAKKVKKMVGTLFYLMLGLTIFKDIFDAVTDLTVIFSILSLVTTPMYTFTLAFYLYSEGIKPTVRKMVTLAISTVLGFIPILNLLPEATISLLLVKYFENNEKVKKITGSKLLGKVTKAV
ncbi:MAG: hypothetical protein NT041_02140 [Candidatus Vogelbacteria bacterium]|nr:hypothetical protein [Candidatus Vogelbacteria bacterium]